MKSGKLKNTAIVTVVAMLFKFLWGRIVTNPAVSSTCIRLIRKVTHRVPERIAAPYLSAMSCIGTLLAMVVALGVLRLVTKTKIPGNKKALTIFLPTVLCPLSGFFLGYVLGVTGSLNNVITVLIIALCSFLLLPAEVTVAAIENAVVKTQKEELEASNRKTSVSIIVFIAAYAVSYIITSKMFASLGIAILVLIAFFLLRKIATKGQVEETAAAKQALAFYNACKKADLNEFTSEKGIARAEAIAKANNLTGTVDYAALYALGKKYAEELQKKVASEEKQERVAKLLEEEKKQSAELNKYATREGNDKTIAMLNEELSSLISQKKSLENFGSTSTKLLTEKEKDWAVAGGIASGIAGGAAGVATALDIQAQNAEIRARNNQVMTQAAQAQMYINSSGAIERLAAQIADKQKELDAEKIKLVGKLAPEDVLKSLTFSDTKAEISESGSVYVSTTVSMPEQLLIFDDVIARIDGTVCAVVSKDGREISKVALVLPKYGISATKSCEVQGITLAGASECKDLTVTFTATHLYAIEK